MIALHGRGGMLEFIAVLSSFLFFGSIGTASTLTAYLCVSKSDQTDVFPILVSNNVYRVSSSMGSTHFFDLEAIPVSDLSGWPTYSGGIYYRGGDNLRVIFEELNSLKVLKPLFNMPVGLT